MIEQGNIYTRYLSYELDCKKDGTVYKLIFKTDDKDFLDKVEEYIITCIRAFQYKNPKSGKFIDFSKGYNEISLDSQEETIITDAINYIKICIYSYKYSEEREKETSGIKIVV